MLVTAAEGAQVLTHADPRHPDILVVDEWTPEHHPTVVAARSAGTRVTVLAEMILDRALGPVVGVTGTAGKTSTCHALAAILSTCGRGAAMSRTAPSSNAWLDHSMAEADLGPDRVLVAEITSTHLCHMDIPRGPDVAVITTIRPDHADLHPGFSAYVAAKRRLLDAQTESDAVVLPSDDPETVRHLRGVRARVWHFGATDSGDDGAFVGPGGVVLRSGDHTAVCTPPTGLAPFVRSTLAAATAALALGVPLDEVAAAVPALLPSPHRLAPVGTFRGARIVDDTMAATPMKCRAGVDAYADQRPVVVLGGDLAPGHDLRELAAALIHVSETAADVVAFGPAADTVTARIGVRAAALTVSGAVGIAATLAGPGGLVLVSPMFPMTPDERDRIAALADR